MIADPTVISNHNFSQAITEAYDGKANDFNIQIQMENGKDLEYTQLQYWAEAKYYDIKPKN